MFTAQSSIYPHPVAVHPYLNSEVITLCCLIINQTRPDPASKATCVASVSVCSTVSQLGWILCSLNCCFVQEWVWLGSISGRSMDPVPVSPLTVQLLVGEVVHLFH